MTRSPVTKTPKELLIGLAIFGLIVIAGKLFFSLEDPNPRMPHLEYKPFASKGMEIRFDELCQKAFRLSSEGKHADARMAFWKAFAIKENAIGPDEKGFVTSLNLFAGVHVSQGNYREAELLYKRSLPFVNKAYGPSHPNVANVLNNLGVVYEGQGKYSDAEPLFKRSLAIREKNLGLNNPEVVEVLENLAALYEKLGNKDEAKQYRDRIQRIGKKQ